MKIPEGIDFNDYIDMVGEMEAQEIHKPSYWAEDMYRLFQHGNELTGDTLPWAKTYQEIRLRPGELSIWAGINGHKKSLIIGQVMLHVCQMRRVAIASLEMKPGETLRRMCCQAGGGASQTPSREWQEKFLEFAEDRILIYDQLDVVPVEKILGFVHYSAKIRGCQHIVIDSLSKCGLADDDRNGEKKFIDRLQWAAKRMGVHIHLVCHIRKPKGGEETIPNKFDVKGTGSITDMADNLFIVWKNKRREKLKLKDENGDELNTAERKYLDEWADLLLLCEKQRHGQFENGYQFYAHGSLQSTSIEGKSYSMDFDKYTGQLND